MHNFDKIDNGVTRMALWRYFWLLVMDRQMSSLTYCEFVLANLPSECTEEIFVYALANLQVLIKNYVPVKFVAEKQAALFKMLQLLLVREGAPKDAIVDKIWSFLPHKAELDLCIEWLNAGSILVDG